MLDTFLTFLFLLDQYVECERADVELSIIIVPETTDGVNGDVRTRRLFVKC